MGFTNSPLSRNFLCYTTSHPLFFSKSVTWRLWKSNFKSQSHNYIAIDNDEYKDFFWISSRNILSSILIQYLVFFYIVQTLDCTKFAIYNQWYPQKFIWGRLVIPRFNGDDGFQAKGKRNEDRKWWQQCSNRQWQCVTLL